MCSSRGSPQDYTYLCSDEDEKHSENTIFNIRVFSMIVDLLEEKKVLENRIGENNISPRAILPGPRYFEVVVVDN